MTPTRILTKSTPCVAWLFGAILSLIPMEALLPQPDAEDEAQLEERARGFIEQNWKLAIPAPDFGADKAWLNVSRPLTLKGDLAGRVVLIDFWTYCCINCMHVLPDLDYLEKKYSSEPFTVVGCHSAKFLNEADAGNVRQAVLRYDIAHPVVVDKEFEIWQSYSIRSWPTLALVGPDGRLLAQLSGEGQRDVLDVLVAQALAFYREKPDALSAKPLPLRRETMAELASELSFPGKISVGPRGEQLYISDTSHNRIVVTTLDGKLVRIFGSGESGLKDGPASEARFFKPQGVAFSGLSLFVADTENHAIRKVDLETGVVSTIAGNGKQGQDRKGRFKPLGTSLSSPWDLLVRGNDLWIAMAGRHQIWKLRLDSNEIGPYAGDGSEQKADGPLADGSFAQPSGLTERDGIVYVADSESSSIRSIDPSVEKIQTVVGGHENPRNLFEFGDDDGVGLGKRLQHPLGVLAHEGVIYVADTYNHKLKIVDPQARSVKSLAGTGKPGSADGSAAMASFHEPGGLAAAGSRLFVADTNNHRIRVVDLKTLEVSTLRLSGVSIPMKSATATGNLENDASPLPNLAGTVKHPAVEAVVREGKATLRLKLSLPRGSKLAAGAPSQFRVLVVEGGAKPERTGGRIDTTEISVPLDVSAKGKLVVQALYYHCQGESTCSVRSASWEIVITPSASGGDAIDLVDEPGS